jgi:hypothetical protein
MSEIVHQSDIQMHAPSDGFWPFAGDEETKNLFIASGCF